jgi:hypothetical protein
MRRFLELSPAVAITVSPLPLRGRGEILSVSSGPVSADLAAGCRGGRHGRRRTGHPDDHGEDLRSLRGARLRNDYHRNARRPDGDGLPVRPAVRRQSGCPSFGPRRAVLHRSGTPPGDGHRRSDCLPHDFHPVRHRDRLAALPHSGAERPCGFRLRRDEPDHAALRPARAVRPMRWT